VTPPLSPSAPLARVVGAAIALFVLGAIGAVQAGRAGASFMRDLELVTPALAKTQPWTENPKTPRLARRVFLVIVDGLRADRSYQLPFLDELRRGGVDVDAQSHYPTWSRPNYVSILTGVPPTASGVRTNFHYTPVMLDSLMDRGRAAGLRVATATDYGLLPSLFLRPAVVMKPEELEALDIDVMLADPQSLLALRAPGAQLRSPFHDSRYVPWPGGFTEAGRALVEGDAELVVLLIGAVDVAGHAHGADSEEYLEATQIADRALARVLADVDLSLDTVIVTADHGHTGRGGHGGVEPEVLTVPLIAAGAGIVPGATVADARLIDVAPTVAALLGIPAPGHGLGRTLVELVQLSPDARDRRIGADRLRLLATTSVVAVSEARAEAALLEDRALRLGLVLGGAALAIALAVILIRRRVLRLDVRVLIVAVPAFFVVYYTLIAILGQRFSPSLLPQQGDITTALLKYAVVGVAVQLLASLWALRTQRTLAQRLATANGIAWTVLMLSMIPAGLMWAFFPPPYVVLPGSTWLVLIPAVQLTVASAAIDVALVLVIEVIVFAARARYRHLVAPGETGS